MKVSVIIVSWNVRGPLRNCLRSVFQQRFEDELEIIVVDNASNDGSAQMVEAEFPQVKLIKSPGNLGFAKGNNLGIQNSRGEYLFLLNPDTLLIQPETFTLMIQFIKVNQKIGVIGPRLLNEDRSLQISARYFPNLLTHLLEMNGRVDHLKRLNQKTGKVDWVSGAAMLIRRKAIKEAGLFDENYFMYTEEMDLQYRMQQKGWGVWYCPEVEIVHLGGKSTEQIKEQGLIWQLQNFTKFTRKHYSKISHVLLKIMTRIGLLMMILRHRGDREEVYRRILKNL